MMNMAGKQTTCHACGEGDDPTTVQVQHSIHDRIGTREYELLIWLSLLRFAVEDVPRWVWEWVAGTREKEMRIGDGGHVHLLPVYSVCILIAPVRVGG